MSPNPSSRVLLLAAAALVLHLAGCEKEKKGNATDEPCEAVEDCGGTQPSCIDLGDGITRCESMCLQDSDCGRGDCLFPEGDVPGEGSTPGVCFRRCDDLEDCASGDWSCEPLLEDSEQGYCSLLLP